MYQFNQSSLAATLSASAGLTQAVIIGAGITGALHTGEHHWATWANAGYNRTAALFVSGSTVSFKFLPEPLFASTGPADLVGSTWFLRAVRWCAIAAGSSFHADL